MSKYDPEKCPEQIIFGGGGLLHERLLEAMSVFVAAKRVAWGCGVNKHGFRKVIHPKFLDYYNLVGLRDFDNPWQYVPCASCLHPAFDLVKRVPQVGFGIYEHYDHPIPIQGPRLNNRGRKDEFADVITWLSCCEMVVTNSYHGAYWSMLLGVTVLLWKPFSNRFHSFALSLPEVDENDWLSKALYSSRHTQSRRLTLEGARKCNLDFSQKVKGLLIGKDEKKA